MILRPEEGQRCAQGGDKKMKKWIGLLFVSLLLGTLWIGVITANTEATGGSSTSYTFYVNVIYDDTQLPASNVEVILEDTTTGSSCSKWTDSAGQVSFNPTLDLSSYSTGDELKIYTPEPPDSYEGSLIIIKGSSVWDGHIFTFPLWPWPSTGQKYCVGYMNLVDGTTKFTLNQPQTIYLSAGTPIYFTAVGATSMSSAPAGYSNADYVSVTYRLFMYRTLTGQQVGTTQSSCNVDIPGKGTPVELSLSISLPGKYYFVLKIEFRYFDENNQPIGGQLSGSMTTLYWTVM